MENYLGNYIDAITTVKKFKNENPKLAEKAESAKEYLKGFYEQLKEDDFIIIEVESYYCVAVVLDYTLPYIVGDHIAPFDENRTYPLQGLETKFAFKRY
jgi:hypothetical protein